MLKILIVDDEGEKLKQVKKLLNEFKDIPDENVNIAHSSFEAKKLLEDNVYDFMILDLNLPERFGEPPDPEGGYDLLLEINGIPKFKKPLNVVVMTLYPKLKEKFKELFEQKMVVVINYDPSNNKWREQVKQKVCQLIEIDKERARLQNSNSYNYDLAIITAVPVEARSILKLDANWTSITTTPNDSTNYLEGIFKNKEKTLRVVTASQHQMGMPAAAVLSMKLIYNFRPRYLAMVGIAAGKQEKVQLGDIIVVSDSWDYGSGKISENLAHNEESDKKELLFLPDPKYIPIDVGLKEKFMKDYSEILYKIKNNFDGEVPRSDLRIHVKPMASGSAVIQNEDIVKKFIDPINRDLYGIEMETYGVYYAAANASEPRPKVFSIKSVCDFASITKNDHYQKYAAYNSAQFLYYFALNEL